MCGCNWHRGFLGFAGSHLKLYVATVCIRDHENPPGPLIEGAGFRRGLRGGTQQAPGRSGGERGLRQRRAATRRDQKKPLLREGKDKDRERGHRRPREAAAGCARRRGQRWRTLGCRGEHRQLERTLLSPHPHRMAQDECLLARHLSPQTASPPLDSSPCLQFSSQHAKLASSSATLFPTCWPALLSSTLDVRSFHGLDARHRIPHPPPHNSEPTPQTSPGSEPNASLPPSKAPKPRTTSRRPCTPTIPEPFIPDP